MLTTRCPDCQTTFRVTSVVLHKAAGQVRCGQCRAVFSAFDSLTDTLTGAAAAELESTTTEPIEGAFAEPGPEPIPDEKVDAVLDDAHEPPPVPWHPDERTPTEARGWRIAAAAATAILFVQVVHHFRSALIGVPLLGRAVERVYAATGYPIAHIANPEDFSIVEWVATAQETETSQPGRLDISAGLRNESDEPLPYPLLSLELTDRWEDVIGARVFTPDEYMGTRMSSNARIRPHTTISAQLQLVDPGPDAYGFEVDVCVAVDQARMRCKSDIVFE